MSAPEPSDHDGDSGPGEPPDDDLLAGEFVLGVLDYEGRRNAEQRSTHDSAFASRIAGWERRLSPWLAQFRPIAVPEHLWQQIRRRLGWQEVPARSVGWWQSLKVWRTATALAAAGAVALWLTRPISPPVSSEAGLTKPVTTLAQSDGRPGWLASVDRAHGTVLMVPVPRAPDAQGRVAELWIIPAGQAPRSLGQVSINRAHTVSVPPVERSALVAPGSVLAITLEPSRGIPHPAPSGPVLARGMIQT